MNIDPAYGDRFEARIRAADAHLDELDAAARARNAQAEMDEISGLRKQRDRVRQHLADVKQQSHSDSPSVQSELDTEWCDLREAIADAHGRYSAWDSARERRFNAHMDEIDAALRRSSARVAEGVADTRLSIAAAHTDLKTKLDTARRNFSAWRERQKDQAAIRTLSRAELELDESFENYGEAMKNVVNRATGQRAD